jgi:hypothetical protein
MENKYKAIAWIRSGMNYSKGIKLLAEISGKQQFISQFSGREGSTASKLAYEICKASGLADLKTWKTFIYSVQEQCQAQGDAENTEYQGTLENIAKLPIPSLTDKPEKPRDEYSLEDSFLQENNHLEYPSIIRRTIHEYASAFQERSRLHSTLVEMPESNADTVCKARKELLDCIKSLSERLELLYQAKQTYEAEGTLPDPELLFPTEPTQMEEDYNCLDQEELKKRKKNLQNGNSKDQSMLDYQSKEHGTAKSPMPQGPKRLKIEYRIRKRLQQILEIETAQLKYVIKE